MWVLGIQSLVPTFVPKVIYPLSYLSTWLVGGSLDQGSGGGEGWAPGPGTYGILAACISPPAPVPRYSRPALPET